MTDDLTADQAAEIREQYLLNGNVESQQKLKMILSLIVAAAERGEASTVIYKETYGGHLTALTGQLHQRGFKVKQTSNQRDGDFVTISWAQP